MTEIKSNKKSVSKVALLLVILTMFLSIFIGVKPVTTYAETLENEQQITVETIVENTVFITFTKGKSEEKGQNIYACYFVPEEYYDSSLEYGVVVFPRWYAERYGVTGNYIDEYDALGLKDTLAILTVQTPTLLEGGRILKCGIHNIPEAGNNLELSYIFYVKDNAGNIGYSSPHHAAYGTLIAEDYTTSEIAAMIGQRVVMETSFKQIVNKIAELVNSFWIYIVIAGATVVVVWGAYIGIRVIVANRKEEKINARGMVKNLIIGIIITFVTAVAMPLLINGLSSWLSW